jgi:hypothetical protein
MVQIRNPLTPPSPLGGEGKGEGRSFEIGIWILLGIWPACA